MNIAAEKKCTKTNYFFSEISIQLDICDGGIRLLGIYYHLTNKVNLLFFLGGRLTWGPCVVNLDTSCLNIFFIR